MIYSSFSTWKRAVNREVEAIAGLGCDDLPDVNFRDMYDDEMPPKDAALEVLEAAEFPMELVF